MLFYHRWSHLYHHDPLSHLLHGKTNNLFDKYNIQDIIIDVITNKGIYILLKSFNMEIINKNILDIISLIILSLIINYKKKQ